MFSLLNMIYIHLSVYKDTHIVQLPMVMGFSDLLKEEPCSINDTRQKFLKIT